MDRRRLLTVLEMMGWLLYLLLCMAVLGGVSWVIWRLRYPQGGG